MFSVVIGICIVKYDFSINNICINFDGCVRENDSYMNMTSVVSTGSILGITYVQMHIGK